MEIGPLLGTILIVLLLLVGAVYFLWQKVTQLEDQREQIKNMPTSTTVYIKLPATTEATSTK